MLEVRTKASTSALRLFEELRITGGQPFVHDQDIGRNAGGRGKGEAHHHPSRIGANRHVEVLPEFGELSYLRGTLAHLKGMNAHIHAAQNDVFASGGIEIEADLDIEQRRNLSRGGESSAGRLVNSGKDLEQCRLARAVAADDSKSLAIADLERDVGQGSHIDAVTRIATEVSSGRGSKQQFFERSAARLIDREIDRNLAQAQERHVDQTQNAMRVRKRAKNAKLVAQPSTVMARRIDHECGSWGWPSNGARTTSMAA